MEPWAPHCLYQEVQGDPQILFSDHLLEQVYSKPSVNGDPVRGQGRAGTLTGEELHRAVYSVSEQDHCGSWRRVVIVARVPPWQGGRDRFRLLVLGPANFSLLDKAQRCVRAGAPRVQVGQSTGFQQPSWEGDPIAPCGPSPFCLCSPPASPIRAVSQ